MKKLISVMLAILLIVGAVPMMASAADEVPEGYIGVYNIEDLYCIRYGLDKNYILMADIDMTEDTAEGGDWDNGYGWAPIGEDETVPFTGTFDGNGHTIKGMQIRGIKTKYAGLFGYVKGDINRLLVDSAIISTSTDCMYVGGIAGVLQGDIKDIVVSNLTLTSKSVYTGGVIGSYSGSSVSNVVVDGTVSQNRSDGYTAYYIGGIMSYGFAEKIENCANKAVLNGVSKTEIDVRRLTGYIYIGGIVGLLESGVINKCINFADITSSYTASSQWWEMYPNYNGAWYAEIYAYSYSGGIVGESNNSILNCYNLGTIDTTTSCSSASNRGSHKRINRIGGIAGTGTVQYCINIGNVIGENASALSCGSIEKCYYLKDTASAGRYGFTDTSTTAVALSSVQMKLKPVFGYLDFENTWFIDTSTGVMHPQLISNPESEYVHTHNYVAEVTVPTCTEKGYTTHTCSVCKDSYKDTYVDALGHNFGEWAETTPATCTAKGVETRSCSRCTASETREIAATGHSYKTTVTAPTCTAQGYTTHTCSCGDSYVDTYVNALGHNYGSWTVVTPATCTAKGSEKHTCTRCTAFETKEIATTGHNYKTTVTAPTCTEQGYTTHTCACGDSYVDTYVNALGHNYGSWTVVTPATCTAKGSEKHTCTLCTAFETREIAATGHSYKTTVTAPTCTAQGYTTHTCSKCKDSYIDTYVKAKGHTDGKWEITKPATTTAEGEKTLYCAECHAVIRTEVIQKIDPSKGSVHSVSAENIQLDYKSTGKLEPVVEADAGVKYTVTYESSNEKVATVDDNGNVKALKRGDAEITVTVTDEFGNTVTDTANVHVIYSNIQWVIMILLFGWLWY